MAPTRPNFLIAGAMRSGTTSLARYLGAHPDVFIAPAKELHFFDLHFDNGLAWYERQFRSSSRELAVGEATQTYMYDDEALDRMAQTLPKARLIVTLRNPVDRAYSHYWLNRAEGREHLEFAEAIEAEPARLEAADRLARNAYSYLDRGNYRRQLEAVCARYPRESLHVLLFEELRDRPAETYRAVCAFLGVDEDFLPENLGQRINRYVTFRSQRVRKAKRRLPRSLARLVGRVNVRPGERPEMNPDVRAVLAKHFAEPNQQLAAWLGRDLPGWAR